MVEGLALGSHAEGCTVDVWVVAGASHNEIVGVYDGALRIRVSAPAEKGRANAAVAGLLKQATSARTVRLEKGARSRRKQFILVGVSASAARGRLGTAR